MTLRDIVRGPDIYVDVHQDYAAHLKGKQGFRVELLEWATPEGRASADLAWLHGTTLVGVEEKKSGDLERSIRARRLSRQLKGLLDAADLAVLALRLELPTYTLGDVDLVELAGWNTYGATVFIPSEPPFKFFTGLRRALGKGERLRLLAGSDRKRPGADDPPLARAFRRQFTSVGPKLGRQLAAYFKGYGFAQALNMRPMVWKEAGAHSGILRQLEELQKGDQNESS